MSYAVRSLREGEITNRKQQRSDLLSRVDWHRWRKRNIDASSSLQRDLAEPAKHQCSLDWQWARSTATQAA